MEIGDKLKAFKRPDQSGDDRSFKELSGEKGLILYAYPRDNTPGCSTEAQDFRDRLEDFKALGYEVVGISKDSVKSHCNFTDKFELTFPLLSDPETTLLAELGAWGEKKNYGKVSMGTIRSTFVFDAKGVLLKQFKNVRAKGHAERVYKDLAG